MKMPVYTCINIWMSRISSRWRKREREWCSHWPWIGFLSNPAVSACSQVSQLQHTTTRCNSLHSLQHTATHWSLFQRSPLSTPLQTHCNSLQLTAALCNSVQPAGVFLKCRLSQHHCSSLQLTATRCSVLQLTAICCNPHDSLSSVASLNTTQLTASHSTSLQLTATHCISL